VIDAGVRAEENRGVLPFYLLVVALSAPVWALGGSVGGELLPGLPVGALAVLAPGTSAVILRWRERGPEGALALLKRSFDVGRIASPTWYVPILFLVPAIFALSFGVVSRYGSTPPEPQVAWGLAPIFLTVFFLSGLVEELGWMGYAFDRMRRRRGALGVAILLGAFWAAWHWPPLLQADRAPSWIAWWSLGTVALRVLHVWLYENGGPSIFAQALFHATFNVSWQLFPNSGSHYAPAVTSPILVVVALVLLGAWRRGATRRRARAAQDLSNR